MKASITTLGCRVNQSESDAIAELLQARGFCLVPFGEACDVAIINTCTVTGESDRKSRQLIRRAPVGAAVIVTGCFAETAPEAAAALGAAAVIGNKDKGKIADIAAALAAGGMPEASFETDPDTWDGLQITVPRRARAYIKIEDGCENRCAYCIIPAARGSVRSKPVEAVLREAATIAASGCCEVILTGIETGSYGRDLADTDLAALLPQVAAVPGIRRIALGSLDPTVLRPAFVETAASLQELLPHFHLSVQSGSDTVLHRMRRKYNADTVLRNMERMRAAIPGVTFSADIIVGFPGETEAEFSETVEFCRAAKFLHLHVFPYSKRAGTEAAEMPGQLSGPEKKRRAAALAASQKETQAALLDAYIAAHRAEPVYVLGEKWEGGVTVGHTEHFIPCEIPTETDGTGKILPVYLTGRKNATLKGETKCL